jgi:uncharacterized delta-60 repeat protein
LAAVLASFLSSIALLAVVDEARGAAGEPDPSFGNKGFTILNEPTFTNEFLGDVLVLPDGKILGGGSRGGGVTGFLLARFNPDGTPDTGFGGSGIKVEPDTSATGDPRAIEAMRLRGDGRIVVAGLARGAGADAFGFGRYLPNGELDPDFGNDGLAMVEVTPSGSAFGMDEAPDEKLVATGDNGNGGKATVVRVTEGGQPDSSFNLIPPGVRFVDVPGSSNEEGNAVSVLGDGTILIGGDAEQGAFLAELQANGEPASGFGSAGVAVHDLGTDSEPSGEIDGIEVLPDGRILATGNSRAAADGDSQAFVARFTSTGDLDPTFGIGGVRLLNPTPGGDETRSLEVLPDGRIVAAGWRGESGPETEDSQAWVLRLTSQGQLDPSFGVGGEAFAVPGPGANAVEALAIQPDGRAVIAGSTGNAGSELLAGRFTADSQPVPIEAVAKKKLRCAGRKATLTGSSKADRIKGTKKADVIVTLGANDRIDAKGGNDLICAGKGKDVVKGGKGRDRILGQAGKDRMVGGPGKDLCDGGAGKDVAAGSCERLKRAP